MNRGPESSFRLSPLAAVAIGLAACGEGTEEETPPPADEPVLPETVTYCHPVVSCAGPAISHQAGLADVPVRLGLGNEDCLDDPDSGKTLRVAAWPANPTTVTEDTESAGPNNLLNLLMTPSGIAQRVTRLEDLQVLRVPQLNGTGFFVGAQSNDRAWEDAVRRVQEMLRANGTLPPVHPSCDACQRTDTRACDEMTPDEMTVCDFFHHPATEVDIRQIGNAGSFDTGVPACLDENGDPIENSEQAALTPVQQAVRRVLASIREEDARREASRRFAANKAA